MQLSPVPPQRQPALVIPQDVPVYRITNDKGFFGPDDCLYPEGSVISFLDEPNTEMEPLNELAMERMREYLAKLDEKGKEAAEKAGKAYISLAHAFENAQAIEMQESKRVSLVGGKETVPLMGAKKKGRPRIAKVEADEPAPLMSAGGKLGLGSQGRNAVNKAVSDKGI